MAAFCRPTLRSPDRRRPSFAFTDIDSTPAIARVQLERRDRQSARAGERSAPKLAWSARRADGGEFTFGAPVPTTAAEAALSAGAEATGRSICAALNIV